MADISRSHKSFGLKGSDTDTRRSNFNAGQRLADTIRTTFGPKGLDKMLVTDDGKIVVTNDGASILDRMSIEHPAAKLVAEVADQQDIKAGDGTTSAVVLTGELLYAAGSLLEKNIHPAKITEGYCFAASRARELLADQTLSFDVENDDQLRNIARTVVTGKWDDSATDFLSGCAVETVRAIERDSRVGFEKITRKTISGGSFYDSEVIEGLIIDLEESSTDVVSPETSLPREYSDATVTLIDEQLSTDKPSGIGAVQLDSYDDYNAFKDYEQDVYEGHIDVLTTVGADVVFCQQSIDDPIRYGLADEGILAIERTRRDELHKLARATGAQPVPIEDLSSGTTGYATTVERRTVGPTEIVIVSGFEEFDQVSLLFRGGTEHVAEETKRMLDDCFYVLKLAIEDEAIIPGGGAVEVELARELRAEATQHDGKEQLSIEAFADALETIPKTLAESAGMDPLDTLIELRKAHYDGMVTAGLDLQSGSVVDVTNRGVLEPLYVKQRAISSATEAANMIVRVDDNISVTRDDHHDHEEEHDHGPGGLVHSTEGYPWAMGHSMGH